MKIKVIQKFLYEFYRLDEVDKLYAQHAYTYQLSADEIEEWLATYPGCFCKMSEVYVPDGKL